MTLTPEEFAEIQAKQVLNEWGYVHSGQAIDYDEVVKMLTEVIIKKYQQQ